MFSFTHMGMYLTLKRILKDKYPYATENRITIDCFTLLWCCMKLQSEGVTPGWKSVTDRIKLECGEYWMGDAFHNRLNVLVRHKFIFKSPYSRRYVRNPYRVTPAGRQFVDDIISQLNKIYTVKEVA